MTVLQHTLSAGISAASDVDRVHHLSNWHWSTMTIEGHMQGAPVALREGSMLRFAAIDQGVCPAPGRC